MLRSSLRFFFLAGLMIAVLSTNAPAQSGLQVFERDRLVIETQSGVQHSFDVEVALSWEQQAQGLMFRRELPRDAGMLFLYPAEGQRAMWMKNTFIPLDILFIDAKGVIVGIVERTVPHSLKTIEVNQLAKAVLELNGGTVSRLQLASGDRIRHEAFE